MEVNKEWKCKVKTTSLTIILREDEVPRIKKMMDSWVINGVVEMTQQEEKECAKLAKKILGEINYTPCEECDCA